MNGAIISHWDAGSLQCLLQEKLSTKNLILLVHFAFLGGASNTYLGGGFKIFIFLLPILDLWLVNLPPPNVPPQKLVDQS